MIYVFKLRLSLYLLFFVNVSVLMLHFSLEQSTQVLLRLYDLLIKIIIQTNIINTTIDVFVVTRWITNVQLMLRVSLLITE